METRKSTLVGLLLAGALIGMAPGSAIQAQAPAYETKQIIQTDLNNIPGQEVLIFTSVWHPGFRLPLHIHPNGHEFTVVIEGEQTFEIDGIGTKVVKAGEVIYTPPNTPHFGRNATDKISRTVVVRIKDKDKPLMVEVKR